MNLSQRFVVPLVVVALAAGAVVWPRWLAPQRVDPCAHPEVLEVTGLIPGSRPQGERRERLSADNIQWSEGLVADPARPREPLVFRMVRSYSVLKSAERPLALMPEPVEPEATRLVRMEAPGGPLPIHVVRTTGREVYSVVAFLYVFGNEPVEQPFLAQLRGVWRELWNGRQPLTVFLAGGAVTPDSADERERLAIAWIGAAWEHYRSMCLLPRTVPRADAEARAAAGETR